MSTFNKIGTYILAFLFAFLIGSWAGINMERAGRNSEMKSVFDKLVETDMLFSVEEREGSISRWVDSKGIHELLSSNSLPEGARVTKFQLLEKTTVTRKTNLERVKDEENSKEKKD